MDKQQRKTEDQQQRRKVAEKRQLTGSSSYGRGQYSQDLTPLLSYLSDCKHIRITL